MQLKLNQNLLQWLVGHQSPTRSKESLSFIIELIKYLEDREFEVTSDAYFNIYAVKNTDKDFNGFYPCFVAHTDTAQKLHKQIQLVEYDGILTGWDGEKQVGAGFDDKVGICIALQLAEQFDNVKLFFPADEESGCIGSSHADLSFFNDVSFCAQPDRRGESDFIYYTNGIQVVSEEFLEESSEMLQDFQYKLNEGTCTDVGQLVHNGIGICCFNISCGYRHEHTNQEYLSVAAAEKCLKFLLQFTKNMSHRKWVYVPDTNQDDTYSNDRLVDLTADLLYELEYVPNLPKKVKSIINELNNLMYGYTTYDQEQTLSSFSKWDDSCSDYDRWNYLEM